MEPNQIEICNMAIANLGTGKLITNIDERTAEAKACKQFFDIAFRTVMRSFPWPFARQFIALALVEEFVSPDNGYCFAYRYPDKCLMFKRILNGMMQDTHESRVPFMLSNDDSGKLILTNWSEAKAEITLDATKLDFFPDDFKIALSFYLSYLIAPMITGGNAFSGIKKQMLGDYMGALAMAQANAANENQSELEPDAEWIRARNVDCGPWEGSAIIR